VFSFAEPGWLSVSRQAMLLAWALYFATFASGQSGADQKAVPIISVQTPEELQKAFNSKNELSVPAHIVIQEHLDLRSLPSAANASDAGEIMDGGKRILTVRVRSARQQGLQSSQPFNGCVYLRCHASLVFEHLFLFVHGSSVLTTLSPAHAICSLQPVQYASEICFAW
jgi:hypothetical protein